MKSIAGYFPIYLLIVAASVVILTLSCTHVAHRAGVEPGVNASVMVGPAINNYHVADYVSRKNRPNKYNTETQISFGYAWKIREKKRFMVQLLVTEYSPFLVSRDNSSAASGGLDIYYQYSGDTTNAGIGMMLGLDPRVYFMVGRDYGDSRSDFRKGLDFGLGFGMDISIIPQLMYTIRYKSMQSSLLLEYRLFGGHFTPCDENCDDEYLKSRFIVGIVFTFDSHK